MKHLHLLEIIALALLGGYGCGTTSDRGKKIHVQTVNGFSGYTVYIRDNVPPPSTIYKIRQPKPKEGKIISSNKKGSGAISQDSLSSLYYYRSSSPNRLLRTRLRRFRTPSD